MATKQVKVRLSKDVVPSRYEITLTPNLQQFTFTGAERITLELKRSTKSITLHAKDLRIAKATIETGSMSQSLRVSLNKTTETATLSASKYFTKGTVVLSLAFNGVLGDTMRGFYRSSYTEGGTKKYLATTQFEATDARCAFPCFDEPAQKAVFDISLNVPKHMGAISNTPSIKTTLMPKGRKLVQFAPTPIMSTYLLAFIVGDLECIEKKSKHGTLVRVFTTKGKKKQAEFALECAVKTVDYFNEYFDTLYPLPKLDMIAIPDFSAGAMENWGAITYRESALLVDAKNSSTMNKQWVALVIAHEIAHQWFGNLVTMEWWTHLWLNEGFASYIEYLAVDHLFPDWDIWTQFLQQDHSLALHYDGLKHTHAIEVEVHDPAEISSVFDAVSYSKGASIIRMIAEYLGEETFRDGLRMYLKKHAYQNAETKDLWTALEEASGKPVSKIMDNWTGKPGYPLISVAEKENALEIRQRRFFASPLSQKNSRDATIWQVPINFGSDLASSQTLLEKAVQTIEKPAGKWVKLNSNEAGFFRTAYSESMRAALAYPLQNKTLPVRDRLGLMRDVAALAETGELSSVDALNFASQYVQEDAYVVWGSVAGALSKIHSLLDDHALHPPFHHFALNLLSAMKSKINFGTVPASHSEALLKVLILESLGKYGDMETIESARDLFARVREKNNPIAPDIRGIVYALVAKHGGAKEYAKLLGMYKRETLHEEKNRITRALASTRTPLLLSKTLDFAFSNTVRPQDSVRIVANVALNKAGVDISWKFIKKHWKVLQKRYGGTRELSYILEPFGASANLSLAKDLHAFLKKHPAAGTERTVAQVLERILSNSAWKKRDSKALREFLTTN